MSAFRSLLSTFALAVILSGCSKVPERAAPSSQAPPASDLTKPVPGDWVVYGIQADPDTLNQILTQDDQGTEIGRFNVTEDLLWQNQYTLKLEPLLASSWDISPNQMVYTFHLRHDVKWHDGVPFTAEDVKFSFDKIMDPKVDAAPLRLYFGNIKSCEVLDPYTVRFTATERYFKTLDALGEGELPILPKHAFDHGDPDFNKNNFGRSPIGTGPYKFVKWDTGEQIVLERNDDYWGPKDHYPKRIVYQIVSEPSTSTQLLKKGELDVINGMNAIQYERELGHTHSMTRLKRIVYPFPSYTYIGFNLRRPMFTDIRVRHAIDLLIPRDEILSQIYLNQYASKCSGYDPPSSPNYNHDVPPTPEDPIQAQKLLTEAGWKNDHGDGILYKDNQPLSFTVLYPAGGVTAEKVLELIQESLSRAGIRIQLDRLEFPQLISKTEDWKFDATLAGWALDIDGDPYQIWHSSQADIKQSSNFIGYKNPKADELITEGRLEYDSDKRAVIFRQLHKLIHDDYPVCFLFNPHTILTYSNRFQNVNTFAPRPCFNLGKWWVPYNLQKYN